MKEQHTHSHRELELLTALRRLGGSARSADLAKLLDVSEETVRRVIKSLSKSGSVERVHGGAYIAGTHSDPSFFRRIAQHAGEKRVIAAGIASEIDDGMTVFLDVGSTTAFVAEELRARRQLTVVTNSIGVAQTLVSHNSNRVHFLGGEMQSDERGTFGYVTRQQARRFACDVGMLSVDAVSAKRGFLYENAAEAALAEVVAECSETLVVGMDHFKFNEKAPHCGMTPERVDRVYTDIEPTGALAASLREWGIKVVRCGAA
ncbi:DeoR/GlpR family DNA-binding transcription regulator [Aliiroseovarius sp. CAU 1755]